VIPLSISFRIFLFTAALVFVEALGCSGPSAAKQSLTPRDFPPYQGQATVLFDDRIDANAVGLADVAPAPRTDPVLKARAQAAEAVARVRVATVSTDSAGGKPAYRLSLELLAGGVVVRRGLTDERIEIAVRPDSPAFGVVKWLDTRLIGRTFVGFFRRYGGADDIELRFHLSADGPEVLAAAHDAAALREFSGK